MSEVIESKCSCGQAVLIESNAKYSCRRDGKRIYYPESDRGSNVFRCKGCMKPIAETCKEAEYE